MNMSKKVVVVLSIFFLSFLFAIKVDAKQYTYLADSTCTGLGMEDCIRNYCTWTGSACVQSNVAKNPCDEQDIRNVLKIFGYILLVVRIAVPLIIIGFGTIDLFKSVIDKDEKSMGKQVKQIILRIVAGFIIFFVPAFINAIFSLSDRLDIISDDQFLTCSECVLEPTKNARCIVN